MPIHRQRVRVAAGLAISAAALLATAQAASATVSGTTNPDTVADAIGANTGNAFTFTVGPSQAGFGNNAPSLSGFPTAGTTYGILTSGDATIAEAANDETGSGESLGINDPGRGDANDSITLRMDFTTPAGQDCLNLDFKFFSEEFPEFVNAGYNDGFIAELDASTWSTSNQTINAPLDFAAGYGDRVAVDTVGPTIVDPANSVGTTYDAATKLLTTKTVVGPGAHSIYLSIFDAGDHIYDSAVFLDNLRFTQEPATACRPPDLFEGKVGAKVKGKFAIKGKNLLVPIQCLLPEGASDPCVGKVAVTASAKGTSAAKAKKITVAKGSYSVPPGSKAKAKAKLTKAGKRLVKARASSKPRSRSRTRSTTSASSSR